MAGATPRHAARARFSGCANPGDHPFARLLDAVKQRFSSVQAYNDVYALADRGPGEPRRPPKIAVPPAPTPGPPRSRTSRSTAGRKARGLSRRRQRSRAGRHRRDSSRWVLQRLRIDTAQPHHRRQRHGPRTPVARVPSSAEDPEGQLEVCDQYNRGARVVNWLAHWIRARVTGEVPAPGSVRSISCPLRLPAASASSASTAR